MDFLSTTHLKQWVNDNEHLFNPPFRTNKMLVTQKDFIVMMLRGPSTRLDFHVGPGDEFFYQVGGEMELVLKQLENGAARRDPTLYYVTIFGEPSTDKA